VNATDNVIENLDNAFMAIDFRPPPMYQEYFEDAYSSPGTAIFCSRTGRAALMSLFRRSQDRWVDMKDPFNNPTYQGAPFVYVAELDTAAIFPGAGSTLQTESAADLTGPRYFVIQAEYLRSVFHTTRYFKALPELTDVKQPTRHVLPINWYTNLVCRSRRRHAILHPAVDHTV
jgi:hypothetical protein